MLRERETSMVSSSILSRNSVITAERIRYDWSLYIYVDSLHKS